MKVKILVEFDVPDTEDEQVAKSAASLAAQEYLSFVEVSGYSADTEEVAVHVDGYGDYIVRLGTDHE